MKGEAPHMRTFTGKFILILVGILIGFAAIEGAMRLGHWLDLEDFFLPLPPWHAGIRTVDEYRTHRILGWEPTPGQVANSMGLLDKEYQMKKPFNTFRIAGLGDSVMAAYFNFLEQIERGLVTDERVDFPVEIWNFAVGGYDIFHYPHVLELKALSSEPDAVIVSFCLNDVTGKQVPVFFKTERGFGEFRLLPGGPRTLRTNPLFFRSHLFRLFTLASERFRKSPSTPYEDQRAHIYDCLQDITDTARNQQVHLFCIVIPYLKPLNQYTTQEYSDLCLLMDALKEFDLDFINVRDVAGNLDFQNLRSKPGDMVHPSLEGHRRIAEIVYPHLLERLLRWRTASPPPQL